MARWRSSMTALAAAILLVSCQPGTDHRETENSATNTSRADGPVLPVAEPPLDREALLLAVARAASASALGMDDRDSQRELDGGRFELRLRFGCPGMAGQPRPGGAFNVRYDANDRRLRLRAAPNVTANHPLIAAAAGPDVETVEGFWVGRPWLLSPGCPSTRQATGSTTAPEALPTANSTSFETALAPRLGLAQFFTRADARTQRRHSRAYEATKVLAADEEPSAQGYDLVLSGRLKRFPAGRVIACVAESGDVPPACVISAQFDRVWIERPDTRETMAEWGSG